MRFTLLGGLKMPSGTGKLVEEQKLRRATETAAAAARTPGRVVSADHIPKAARAASTAMIALGRSIDGIVGGAGFASWDRLFVTASVQHAIRMEGAYRYQYGDETQWFVGVGGYLLLGHDRTLTLQVVTSGKYQGTDTLEGTSTAPDGGSTATTWVFVGPGLSFTYGTSLGFELAGDCPSTRRRKV